MLDKTRMLMLRIYILGPFGQYKELTERERTAATLYAQGIRVAVIANFLSVGNKTAYRVLEAAAEKIAIQDDIENFEWIDIPRLVWQRLHKLSE